ncbi:MAG: bifunctional phosphopantothenoylcysteine decarboxylase/phosphopantothenate--cysteine ligase CoaBC [Eggerthellaceae bacterium]|nr:bifunctional phosphopantothenoylcysteine decarboxylase/phosphopantothenate--cysteine ligase CoaBC [Eggerthellaceae bacterium]
MNVSANISTSLAAKTVLLGVTGCVAAYKSAEIVRGLQKAGVRVKVVMTEHAGEFIGATTFRALTREPVAMRLFDEPGDAIHHISLAKEADLFLIAPCTANVMAKIAWGIADDILTTTALATTAPLLIAPAMNVGMYENPATVENMKMLADRGVQFIEADEGYLACGDVGKGRLAEVDVIVARTLEALEVTCDLAGKRVMITAGPTVEAIDPVRCITNHSSGKMGYALAGAALRRGAQVTILSGPVSVSAAQGVTVVPVTSASDMLEAARACFGEADIAIFAAAVCDMRPVASATSKLKKETAGESLRTIELVENPDILATLAAEKQKGQVVVGFAAETDEVLANGKKKLASKKADLIVANHVGNGIGFGQDANKAWLIKANEVIDVPEMPKDDLADIILNHALELL